MPTIIGEFSINYEMTAPKICHEQTTPMETWLHLLLATSFMFIEYSSTLNFLPLHYVLYSTGDDAYRYDNPNGAIYESIRSREGNSQHLYSKAKVPRSTASAPDIPAQKLEYYQIPDNHK